MIKELIKKKYLQENEEEIAAKKKSREKVNYFIQNFLVNNIFLWSQ